MAAERYLSRRIPDLHVGNNIDKIDKKPVPSIYTSLTRGRCTKKACVSVRVNVGTFGHSRVQLFLGTGLVVQCNVSNDI